jgi:hypothetical protein
MTSTPEVDSLKAELERVNELASERLREIERLKGIIAQNLNIYTPEQLAQKFHDIYERRAPEYGYTTRRSSAQPWQDVPEPNKSLMIAVAAEILKG